MMKKLFRLMFLLLLIISILNLCACSTDILGSESVQPTTISSETFKNYIVTAEEVNVRDKPSTKDSTVLDTYPKNTLLKATTTSDKSWNKILLNDSSVGYVYSDFVYTISDEKYEEYKNYQITDKAKKFAVVSGDYANIRDLPNTNNSNIVAVYRKNDTIEILATTKNNWYVMKHDDNICYISSDVVDKVSKEEYDGYEKKPETRDSTDNCELIGSYTTNYSSSNTNRNYNVEKSAGVIDGMIICPKAMFNWDRDMGPCGQYEGYKESNEILNGKYVKGYGGGICQLSSTLCASVIKSDGDFEFIERHKHSIAQPYIPSDLDATVSYPDCNFIFRNDNSFSIMIKTSCVDYNLTVEIYKVK